MTLRNVLTSALSAAAILGAVGAATLVAASPAAAQGAKPYSYGGVTYTSNVRAYTFTPQSGQMGGVTFYGARPYTMPSHNGQVGNVTYLGGARPYTYAPHNGQVGNITYLGNRPMTTVPVPVVRTPNVIRIR
jgi:hypothetical protein